MTVCNMSIEAGARAGMIAPDDTTFEYLKGRPRAPQGAAWDAAVADWRELPQRRGRDATTARRRFDARALEPMITYGTNPGMGIPITRRAVPDAATAPTMEKALEYMGLTRGRSRCSGHPIDVVFIGCCTNSRLVRPAPGGADASRAARSPPACARWSCRARSAIKKQAEAEGLDTIFTRRGRRVARGRLLDVHRDERRPAQARGSTRSAPATATSRAGRARAGARSSRQPAHRRRRRRHRQDHRRRGSCV